MGGSCFLCANIYSRCPSYMHYRNDFERCLMNARTIGKLHRTFKRLKKRGQGGVDVDFLLSRFNIPVTDLSRAVFCVDKDHSLPSTVIDFPEFVLCIWNLCTQPHDLMANYFLDLLGKPVEDVSSLCMEIWGERLKLEPELMAIFRDLLTSEHSRKMTPSNFSHLCESCPALLQPLLGMQRKCRKETLGSRAWEDLTNRRTALNYSIFVFKRQKVIAKFTPKVSETWMESDLTSTTRDRITTELTDAVCSSSPRGDRLSSLSVDDEKQNEDLVREILSWKPGSLVLSSDTNSGSRGRYPSQTGSNEDSQSTLSHSDVNLRSRESIYSSTGNQSDISSLTNFTHNSGHSNDFPSLLPGSPKPSLLQISRHARRYSDPAADITGEGVFSVPAQDAPDISPNDPSHIRNFSGLVYIGTAAVHPFLPGPSFRRNGSHTTITALNSSAASTSAQDPPSLTSSALVFAPSGRHSQSNVTSSTTSPDALYSGKCAADGVLLLGAQRTTGADHAQEYNAANVKPPSCSSNMCLSSGRAKIMPVDADSMVSSSSDDDEDTINGAMGWTKTCQRPKGRKRSFY